MSKIETIKILNCSKQMIPLQVRSPGGDFYNSEQQIRLRSGGEVTLIKSHVLLDQIKNLQKRKMIKIVHDSEINQ